MTYFVAIIAAISLAGCCSINRTTPCRTVAYKYENYNFFVDGRSPSLEEFNKTTENALNGDNQNLERLLSWANLTDGEGSLSYTIFLLNLQKTVGEKRFLKAFNNLSPEDQGIIKTLITTSEKLHKFTTQISK